MSIQGNEKSKTQKIICKIQKGDFEDNDIDNLFMKLRAYSKGFNVFIEIGDFIAHNDVKKKGITSEAVEKFSLNMKYHCEYALADRKLNLSIPFPIYIKRLMRYQIDNCDEKYLKKEFNVNKKELKGIVETFFLEVEEHGIALLDRSKIAEKKFQTYIDAISYSMGFIYSKPAYTQKHIIDSIIHVLRKNNMDFDEKIIRVQGDKIMLCILTLLHNTELQTEVTKKNYEKLGECSIGCTTNSILYELTEEDYETIKFGELQIHATINVPYKGETATVSFPIVETNLQVKEWCSEEMFEIKPFVFENGEMSDSHPLILSKKISFDKAIGINENFKLIPLIDY